MQKYVDVQVKKLENLGDLPLPAYATLGSAGMDLVAAITTEMRIRPLQRVIVPTGIAIAIPLGYEVQIRPRSGLAIKNGIMVLNTPGTIDSDYRGEICVILANLSEEEFVITPGMRIAQAVLNKYEQISWNVVETLDETARGAGGFGSTGVTSDKKQAA